MECKPSKKSEFICIYCVIIKYISKNIVKVNRFIGLGFMVLGFGVGVWCWGLGVGGFESWGLRS